MANSTDLKPCALARAREQLQGYRFTLSDAGRFALDSRPLGVTVRHTRGRFAAVSDAGATLWTGADLAGFVRRFWHAEKAAQ